MYYINLSGAALRFCSRCPITFSAPQPCPAAPQWAGESRFYFFKLLLREHRLDTCRGTKGIQCHWKVSYLVRSYLDLNTQFSCYEMWHLLEEVIVFYTPGSLKWGDEKVLSHKMKSALCSPCRIRIQALLLPRAHAGSHCGENSAAVTPLSTSHPAHSSLTPGKQLGSPCWRAQTQEREENSSTFDASTGFGNFWLKEDRVSQLREAPQVLTSDLLPVVQAAVMLTALPRQEHGAQLFQGFPAHPIPLGSVKHWENSGIWVTGGPALQLRDPQKSYLTFVTKCFLIKVCSNHTQTLTGWFARDNLSWLLFRGTQ